MKGGFGTTSYITFLAPAIAPYAIRLTLQKSDMHLAMGLMLFMFIAAMLIVLGWILVLPVVDRRAGRRRSGGHTTPEHSRPNHTDNGGQRHDRQFDHRQQHDRTSGERRDGGVDQQTAQLVGAYITTIA